MPQTTDDIVMAVLAALAGARDPSSGLDFHTVGYARLAQRLAAAARELSDLVTVDPEVRGGVPVLSGTRLPVARILAEVAEDRPLSEIAEDHDLSPDALPRLFHALATFLERPCTT